MEQAAYAGTIIFRETAYSTASYDAKDQLLVGVPVYEPHEIELIAEMKDNVKAISLVLIASRVMRQQLMLSHEQRDEVVDLNDLCAPAIRHNRRMVQKLVVSSKLTKYLLQKINITVDEELCHQLLMRLACNVTTITDEHAHPLATGLFPFMAAINHSCLPNVTQSFDGVVVSIVASRCISAHEEVCISYIDSSKSTWCRHLNLMRSYCFYCQCERCSKEDSLDGFRCECDVGGAANRSMGSICRSINGADDRVDSNSLDYIDSDDADMGDVVDCFEDLCLPCGEILLPQIAINEPLRRWLCSEDDAATVNLNIGLTDAIPSFVCSNCSVPSNNIRLLNIIRIIFQLWRDYSSSIGNITSSAVVVVVLRHNQNLVKILEQILDQLRSVVYDLHYSIVQVTEKLTSRLTLICSTYEDLIKLSPNNERLKSDLVLYKHKLVVYSEMMTAALAICCPNYTSAL